MGCHHPIPAYLDSKGKVQFVNRRESLGRLGLITLRCGMCRGCKADHAREWSIRAYHEAQLHDQSCFITATYDPEHLPAGGSLYPRDLELFFKRLRKNVGKRGLRYFACGEYGEKRGRPHYHICLFGYCPELTDLAFRSAKGHPNYRSELLDRSWQKGNIFFTTFDASCARYTAHYTADKLKGFAKDEICAESGLRPYERLEEATGEIWPLCPEFQRQSNRPGLGIGWLEKNWKEVFPADSVVMDGREYPPPKAYWKWLKANHPDVAEKVGKKRRAAVASIPYETGLRKLQRTQFQVAQLDRFERPTHGSKK